MLSQKAIQAIIWDYDITLADTRQKNLTVTKTLLRRLTGSAADNIPALQSLEHYMAAVRRQANWRDFYRHELGLTEAQTDAGGQLWAEIQIEDQTTVPLYEGIIDLLRSLQHLPHGIVSQNGRNNITSALRARRVLQYFQCIIGFEEVGPRQQKPAADGLLLCIEQLTALIPGIIIYIGDHETDAKCAFNANLVLHTQHPHVHVVSIGAFYGADDDDASWVYKPDYKAYHPQHILDIIRHVENNGHT